MAAVVSTHDHVEITGEEDITAGRTVNAEELRASMLSRRPATA